MQHPPCKRAVCEGNRRAHWSDGIGSKWSLQLPSRVGFLHAQETQHWKSQMVFRKKWSHLRGSFLLSWSAQHNPRHRVVRKRFCAPAAISARPGGTSEVTSILQAPSCPRQELTCKVVLSQGWCSGEKKHLLCREGPLLLSPISCPSILYLPRAAGRRHHRAGRQEGSPESAAEAEHLLTTHEGWSEPQEKSWSQNTKRQRSLQEGCGGGHGAAAGRPQKGRGVRPGRWPGSWVWGRARTSGLTRRSERGGRSWGTRPSGRSVSQGDKVCTWRAFLLTLKGAAWGAVKGEADGQSSVHPVVPRHLALSPRGWGAWGDPCRMPGCLGSQPGCSTLWAELGLWGNSLASQSPSFWLVHLE